MTDDPPPNPALLPAGLRDLLPPEAEIEAATVEALMAVFTGHGYRRVKPPLLEFEDSLLSGSGAAMADQTFRLMDPDTHRMMGVRADMTPQIGRIAATRLAHAPRPLRLCYAGQCLRVHGGQLDPDRQIAQAGIELIGHDSPEADAEIVLVAAEALQAVGLSRLSFDLTMPTLVPAMLDEAEFVADARSALRRALDRKDAAAVGKHGGTLAGTLSELLLAAGPADGALAALAGARLTPRARVQADRLAATVAAIRAQAPGLTLTVDPVEFRGLKYHTGVCMTVYGAGRQGELGRGGRYFSGDREPGTGLTLYPDAVLRAAAPPAPRLVVYVPFGAGAGHAAALRQQGHATVAGLVPAQDNAAEAVRLGCTHRLSGAALVAAGES